MMTVLVVTTIILMALGTYGSYHYAIDDKEYKVILSAWLAMASFIMLFWTMMYWLFT